MKRSKVLLREKWKYSIVDIIRRMAFFEKDDSGIGMISNTPRVKRPRCSKYGQNGVFPRKRRTGCAIGGRWRNMFRFHWLPIAIFFTTIGRKWCMIIILFYGTKVTTRNLVVQDLQKAWCRGSLSVYGCTLGSWIEQTSTVSSRHKLKP